MKIVSWNIQGYSEDKLATIQHFMTKYGIGIVCIQEVRKFSSEYLLSPEGFLCIFSGSSKIDDNKNDAGVGFIIAVKQVTSALTLPQFP